MDLPVAAVIALALVAAYLIGSLSFAVIVSRLFGLADPRSLLAAIRRAAELAGLPPGAGAGPQARPLDPAGHGADPGRR